ncbi:FAD-binding and (Fe-S)-binding domain-containing protein [Candidatus Protochlamydia phocaeensis]|uniref:FAD-binding and (Fe-S)-binding domain-containing protein n=1 Tax=Candidatus Protochlamydia phocaeensis TaxID=1414722 RepID=UPI0008382CD1|nr:FAD-binding and (Fe-S)-binding domain-containing protein [Candidatus Protochlamydia phocaeensis]
MRSIQEELKDNIEGQVYFDPTTRHIYSVDASIFEVQPLGVVIPKSKLDLLRAVEIANHYKVPLTARGAATGITGGCLGRGLIIDTSKYLNRILTIDIQNGYTVCEPGVVQDDLNKQLSPYGYRLGPDTSTGNRATLGGMLANNAAGSRSLRYGRMVDHVKEAEVILANGEILLFGALSEEKLKQKMSLKTTEGHIYREIIRIRDTYRDEIEKRFPRIPRRVSGYNLDELIKDEPINIAKLITGSEGTLGIATEITMNIAPKPKSTGMCLLFFQDMIEALRHIPALLAYSPIALEMIDDQIIELGRASPSLRGQLDWLSGNPKALLIVEIDGEDRQELEEKMRALLTDLRQNQIGYDPIALFDRQKMAKVWNLRKSGLGILLSKRSFSRAIAFIEDISVDPHQLAPFMERFCAYLSSKGKSAGIYGHVGSGCMHVRPYINLRSPEELALMREMMIDVSSLLLEYGGSLSGEHGDGLIRSWLNPKMFGEKLIQAFIELKRAFDPDDLMNPGKIIAFSSDFEELRSHPSEILKDPQTFLNFNKEGGFILAADLCNGNGLCRKKEKIMCPSFQATNEEFHSTRARAQSLRSIIHGRMPLEAFTSQGLYDVMDLCLLCKGCKTECPSQVDMAKMKSEFLYHYQETHGYSLRSRLFASIGQLNRWMSPLADFFNLLHRQPWTKKALERLGMTSHRNLPLLASQRFSTWYSNFLQPSHLNKSVLLLNDTFNEFNHPHIGQAAVHLLNALGYKVIVPSWSCCGRPALSKGLLKQARKQARKLLSTLAASLAKGALIIGLEPSCILTIKDDYLGLIDPNDPLYPAIELITSRCLTLDEFLLKHVQDGTYPLPFPNKERLIKVHGHCYQKALVGMAPTLDLLRSIPGFYVSEIPSGCCGMAGSFGYESEHYDISMKIGELQLFPHIRKSMPDTWIIANGTSCRHQIQDGTGRQALHLAEALYLHLKDQ